LNENASRLCGLGILDPRVRFGVYKSGDLRRFIRVVFRQLDFASGDFDIFQYLAPENVTFYIIKANL
jgi:hypothetical protein